MKNKVITYTTIFVLLIISIGGCYLKDYDLALKYSKDASKFFISTDSITVTPYFYVKDWNTLGAVIDFSSLSDSLILEDLNVTVHSIDNPNQSINLKYVSTVIHPLITAGGNLQHLEVNGFNDLSLYDRTIKNAGLPYNAITFYFKTWQITRTDFYEFKISGKLFYKGQRFNFEKNITTQRVFECHPYRMMT